MPLSPAIKAIVIIFITIIALMILFVIVISAVGPTIFPAMIKSASFSDCVMISAMHPILSTDKITAAIYSCAKESKVSIVAISFEAENPGVIIAKVDYVVSLTSKYKWYRHVEEEFRVSK